MFLGWMALYKISLFFCTWKSEIQNGHTTIGGKGFKMEPYWKNIFFFFFFSETENLIESKLYMNYQWMVPFKIFNFVWIWDPRWPPLHDKVNVKPYEINILKLFLSEYKRTIWHCLTAKLTDMFLGWLSTKCYFFLCKKEIQNRLPPQKGHI